MLVRYKNANFRVFRGFSAWTPSAMAVGHNEIDDDGKNSRRNGSSSPPADRDLIAESGNRVSQNA